MRLPRIPIVFALLLAVPCASLAQETEEWLTTVAPTVAPPGSTCPTCVTTPGYEGSVTLSYFNTGATSVSGYVPATARVRRIYLSATYGTENVLIRKITMNVTQTLFEVLSNGVVIVHGAADPITYPAPGPLASSPWSLYTVVELLDYEPWELEVQVTLDYYVPPVNGPYDVGVIPETATCPGGTPPITIHMDDEDNNDNRAGGWIGATGVGRNTDLRYCAVDGRLFKPLATTAGPAANYAVLKLSPTCPAGSTEFTRYFDNEDSYNANWYSGAIAPNLSQNAQSGRSYTQLFFCLFGGGTDTMSEFPLIGQPYGVYAGAGLSKALATGYRYTDDENTRNGNWFYAPPSIAAAAPAIIVPGINTWLYMAKVR